VDFPLIGWINFKEREKSFMAFEVDYERKNKGVEK
jgi:hypothetical protein